MLSRILKEHTKTPHQELESAIIYKIKQLGSTQSYINFLKVFYGYLAAVEEKISASIDTGVIEDYAERRKGDKLLDDISVLSVSSGSIPLAQNTPEITNNAQALGAMYVLEGSTLGGKYISRMVSQQLQLPPEDGFSFFNGYREQTDTMWEKFKTQLDNHSSINTEGSVIEAANQTFIKFKIWIDEH